MREREREREENGWIQKKNSTNLLKERKITSLYVLGLATLPESMKSNNDCKMKLKCEKNIIQVLSLANIYKYTRSLSDFRKRRSVRLPSGTRTRIVTAFSSSREGSAGSDANFAFSSLSNSYSRRFKHH